MVILPVESAPGGPGSLQLWPKLHPPASLPCSHLQEVQRTAQTKKKHTDFVITKEAMVKLGPLSH